MSFLSASRYPKQIPIVSYSNENAAPILTLKIETVVPTFQDERRHMREVCNIPLAFM